MSDTSVCLFSLSIGVVPCIHKSRCEHIFHFARRRLSAEIDKNLLIAIEVEKSCWKAATKCDNSRTRRSNWIRTQIRTHTSLQVKIHTFSRHFYLFFLFTFLIYSCEMYHRRNSFIYTQQSNEHFVDYYQFHFKFIFSFSQKEGKKLQPE